MLKGLKVIELASHIAAPSAGAMLADWGAEVIKVERPEGDSMRVPRHDYRSAMPEGATSPTFQLDNRGKRSVVIDIRQPRGAELLHRLLRDADVFITNMRPRALRKMRLDWASLEALNPRLVAASVSGFGLDGPDADLPGYDVSAFWARAGVASLMTPADSEPFPLRTGMGDHVCGLATAFGIMTALFERTRTGKGRLVEASLLRAGLYAVSSDLSTYSRIGRVNATRARHASSAPLVNFYRTRDERWFCLMPRNARADWPKIAQAAGRGDLIDDPRFNTDVSRSEHVRALVTLLDAAFGQMTLQEVTARFIELDIVFAPVQSPSQVLEDPQVRATQAFVRMQDDYGGSYPSPGSPVRFHGVEERAMRSCPRLGQDTDEVLGALGIDQPELRSLRETGVIA